MSLDRVANFVVGGTVVPDSAFDMAAPLLIETITGTVHSGTLLMRALAEKHID